MPRIKETIRQHAVTSGIATGIAVACAVGGPLGVVAGAVAGALFADLLEGSAQREAARHRPGWDFGAVDTTDGDWLQKWKHQAQRDAEFYEALERRASKPAPPEGQE